jgi:hypothetical protein
MRNALYYMFAVLTIVSLLWAPGCGKDEIVLAPPGCPVTECVSLTLSAAEWTPGESYIPDPDEPFTIMWSTADLPGVIENLSPGDRLRVEIAFSPPLVVTDHVPPEITVSFKAWDQDVVSFSGFGFGVDPRVQLVTSKGTIDNPVVRVEGNDATGSIDWVASSWLVDAPAEGDLLTSFVVEFTIPARFDNFDPIADNQTIILYQAAWSVVFTGDRRGSRPPVMPMEPPPVFSRQQ